MECQQKMKAQLDSATVAMSEDEGEKINESSNVNYPPETMQPADMQAKDEIEGEEQSICEGQAIETGAREKKAGEESSSHQGSEEGCSAVPTGPSL